MSVPERVIIGVDPGGRSTGVVATRGTQVLGEPVVIERPGRINQRTIVDRDYITEVLTEIGCLERAHHALPPGRTSPVIAVEGINAPSPHLGMTNAAGAIATGVVLGAVMAAFPVVVLVAPGEHGSKPLAAYPKVLVGPRERGTYGSGRLRHARSAYDVAMAARTQLRIKEAS